MKMFTALGAVSAIALSLASPAAAADISFLGNLAGANDVLSFNFNVGADSTVTLRSYSYAGGTNAQGAVIARGGFDPILSLYNGIGNRIAFQDDGPGVPVDPVTNAPYDVLFSQFLSAGSYTVKLSAYSNFCGLTLADGCQGGGSFTDATGNLRDAHFAFDILNVEDAIQTGGGDVPEPAMLGLFGLGAIGLGLTRRRRA